MTLVSVLLNLVFYLAIAIAVINASDFPSSPKRSPPKSTQGLAEDQRGGDKKPRRSERIKEKQEQMEHREAAVFKAHARLAQSRAAKKRKTTSKKDTEEIVSGMEGTIRQPIVVPYTDPEPSSSSNGQIANSTIRRATPDDVEKDGLLMRQVCTCASCTEAAVQSYKRLVNEGKVTDYRSFGEYWTNRCLCGVRDPMDDIDNLLNFYDVKTSISSPSSL